MLTIVDGRCFVGAPTGVSRYIKELVCAAAALNPQRRYLIALPSHAKAEKWPENVHLEVVPLGMISRAKPIIWVKCLGSWINQQKPSRFLACAAMQPWGLARHIESTVVVHDLNHVIAPETMPWGTRVAFKAFYRSDITNADNIICNSHGTSARLLKYCGRRGDIVINPLIAAALRSATPDYRRCPAEPFILAVSTIEPRKNTAALVRAFVNSQLIKETNYHLVIVGMEGWGGEAKRLGSCKRVRLLGYATDAEIRALYQKAQVFFMPSLYEGFGMPVREASFFGCPVVCADLPELQEASHGRALHIQPTEEAIKAAFNSRVWEDMSPNDPFEDRLSAAAERFLREHV